MEYSFNRTTVESKYERIRKIVRFAKRVLIELQ